MPQKSTKHFFCKESNAENFLGFIWRGAYRIFMTITREYYPSLLYLLQEAIKTIRPHLAQKKLLFYQDNVAALKFTIVALKVHDLRS